MTIMWISKTPTTELFVVIGRKQKSGTVTFFTKFKIHILCFSKSKKAVITNNWTENMASFDGLSNLIEKATHKIKFCYI